MTTRIIKLYSIVCLSLINLIIYILLLNGFIKHTRQTIFYFSGIYITSTIVLLTILYMIIKRRNGLIYWIILTINTIVLIYAYLYLQDVLCLKCDN